MSAAIVVPFPLAARHVMIERQANYAAELRLQGGKRVLNKPFVPFEIGNFGIAPGIFSGDELKAAGVPLHLQTNDMTPEVDMLQIMEMIRRKPCARFPERPKRINCGGRALLTKLTKRGATQKVLVEWPDVVGEHILQPAPIDWRKWRDVHDFRRRLTTSRRAIAA